MWCCGSRAGARGRDPGAGGRCRRRGGRRGRRCCWLGRAGLCGRRRGRGRHGAGRSGDLWRRIRRRYALGSGRRHGLRLRYGGLRRLGSKVRQRGNRRYFRARLGLWGSVCHAPQAHHQRYPRSQGNQAADHPRGPARPLATPQTVAIAGGLLIVWDQDGRWRSAALRAAQIGAFVSGVEEVRLGCHRVRLGGCRNGGYS